MLFYCSTALGKGKEVTIYAGKDKFENEDLIRYAFPEVDVWTHVDKLSSAHMYIRMPDGMEWTAIPEAVLNDAAQLVKANSIEGNKRSNITVIYTPVTNLKKTGAMDTGTVSFHNDKLVKRVYVRERDNAIVNRLNKTKVEREVDHEAVKVERERELGRQRRMDANTRRNAELELARRRKAEAEARSYDNLHVHKGTADEIEQAEWEARQRVGDFDPDDDFM